MRAKSIVLVTILVVFSLVLICSAYGQDSIFNESGVITGVGTGNTSEGHYQPVFLIWHLSKDLNTHVLPIKNREGKLSFVCEPQINPVFHPRADIELGIGFGLQYGIQLSDRIIAYIIGTTGPHFITLKNEDQSNGFVFADTIGAGAYFPIDKNHAINAGYRWRHLSNGGIQCPNGGINSHVFILGYSVFF
jgi:hypothetical protein